MYVESSKRASDHACYVLCGRLNLKPPKRKHALVFPLPPPPHKLDHVFVLSFAKKKIKNKNFIKKECGVLVRFNIPAFGMLVFCLKKREEEA